jgi:hypothetical protein
MSLTAEDRAANERIVEAAVAKALAPVMARLAAPSADDESIGPETQASIEAALAEIAAGEPMLTTAEVLAELGLDR